MKHLTLNNTSVDEDMELEAAQDQFPEAVLVAIRLDDELSVALAKIREMSEKLNQVELNLKWRDS